MPSLALPARSTPRGFTLLEVLIAVMIVGILTTIASASYRDYVVRAQLAQQLVFVDHVRTAVTLASRDGQRDLHLGALAGEAPPALAGDLHAQEFRGLDGLRLQLVRWPQAAPGGPYALVASVDGTAGERRLGLFQREIDRAGFGNAWLSPHAFIFRIADDAAGTSPVVSPMPGQSPATGPAQPGGAPGSAGPTGSTPDTVVTAPASGAAGGTVQTPAPGTGGPTPSGTTPTVPRPPGGACPPGTSAIGNSGQCRSTTGACPPGMHPVGNSGHCKP